MGHLEERHPVAGAGRALDREVVAVEGVEIEESSNDERVDWHPDGKRLASLDASGEIRIWNLVTGETECTLDAGSTDRMLANADTLTGNLARASQHADSLVRELQHTSAALDTMLSRINRGEGTLGRLASDTSLYNDARRTSQALTLLLDEIRRNPGKLTIQFKVF